MVTLRYSDEGTRKIVVGWGGTALDGVTGERESSGCKNKIVPL